jgi:DNA-directed RNA polymerase specialized sigma subunit
MRNYRLEREVRKAEISTDPLQAAINQMYSVRPRSLPTGEEIIKQIMRKKAARRSEFTESADFPGLFFKKTPIQRWLELNKAEYWETAYDFMHRVYRVEQIAPKELAIQWEVSKYVVNHELRAAGVPPLHSSEYIDPHRAATAKRWEDREKRKNTQVNLRKAWIENKAKRIMCTQSNAAKELRRVSIQQARHRNGNQGRSTKAFQRMVTEQVGVKEREKKEVLGDNPKERLKELFEVQGLSYQAAVIALKHAVSATTIRRWSIEEGTLGLPTTTHDGLKASQYERYVEIYSKKDHWGILTSRQQEVLALIKNESGKFRQNQEIADIMGVTTAAVIYLIKKASQTLSALEP